MSIQYYCILVVCLCLFKVMSLSQTENEGQRGIVAETTVGSWNASDQRCFESFIHWHSEVYSMEYKRLSSTGTFTTTDSFRIDEGVGQGTLYTECDGIPRFRFHSPPSKTVHRTVSVVRESILYESIACCGFLDAVPVPDCRIDPRHCGDFRSLYLTDRLKSGLNEFNYFKSADQYMNAPGGCAIANEVDCRIEAGAEVILIYWPPEVHSRDICAADGYGTAITASRDQKVPLVVTTDAITFHGLGIQSLNSKNLNEEITSPFILPGPFTFTSPTVYLAHHSINVYKKPYVPDIVYSTDLITSRPPGVVPLQPHDVYSIRPKPQNFNGSGIEYARLVAEGVFGEAQQTTFYVSQVYEIKPFDYGHLQNPVPASLYYDARVDDCWAATQTHCGTITDDTYRPRLVFPNRVWASIMPKAFDCVRPEFVDPPVALRPAYNSQTQLPVVPTALAQPANQPAIPWPSPTKAAAVGYQAEGSSEDAAQMEEHHKDDPLSARHSSILNAEDGGSASNEETEAPAATINIPSRVGPSHGDPSYSIKVGSHTLSASFESGSIVAVYMDTSVLHNGQYTTVEGKIVSIGNAGVFVDGTVALPAAPNMRSSSSTMIRAHGNSDLEHTSAVTEAGDNGGPPVHQTNAVASPKLVSSKKKSQGSNIASSDNAIGIMVVLFFLTRFLLAVLVP